MPWRGNGPKRQRASRIFFSNHREVSNHNRAARAIAGLRQRGLGRVTRKQYELMTGHCLQRYGFVGRRESIGVFTQLQYLPSLA